MRMWLVTLAVLSPLSDGSLGIGIDVLPEAFGFAARRAGLSAIMVLKSCTDRQCLWDLGDGVSIEAERTHESLDITRVEATLAATGGIAAASTERYERACLAIVALVDRETDPADQRLEAKAIASPSSTEPRGVRIRLAERRVKLYGAHAGDTTGARPVAKRCGAVAA